MSPKNRLTLEQRNEFLTVLRALLKVLNTSTPAPEDVNTLLLLSRDLTKDVPKDGLDNVLPGFSFDAFGIEIDGNAGLLEDGDIIVNVEGVPHINTQFGKEITIRVLKKINFGICRSIDSGVVIVFIKKDVIFQVHRYAKNALSSPNFVANYSVYSVRVALAYNLFTPPLGIHFRFGI